MFRMHIWIQQREGRKAGARGFLIACCWLWFVVRVAGAADLVSHWHLNESGPPFADAGAHVISLVNDVATTPAISGMGIEGAAALLHVDAPPVSTRLYAQHSALQKDSFGFSFWINPVSINPFDNLLAKEMSFDNSVPGDERLAWQVHILNNNGSGSAAVEFLVRGDDRAKGNFFGSVVSSAAVPLFSGSSQWIHIAGGYDSVTGVLRLYVNGVESVTNGTPGAKSSDGAPLALGAARNGSDLVAFAASAFVEDFQVYGEMLWPEDVEFLMENPGLSLPADFAVQSAAINPATGDFTLRFDTVNGGEYLIQAATGLSVFAPMALMENSVNLVHDAGTAGPWTVAGREGSSVLLRWQDPPGVATRLFANHPSIQSDSFGFSFWIRPMYLNPWDNVIAKEMAYDNSIPAWSRLAWQVHVLDDNGSGAAQVELVVRGAHRTVTNFYGLVASSSTLPLYTDSPDWVHIAGGYDALTGELRLYVNGASTSVAGIPGAKNGDGSPLALGTVRNGADVVQYAAVASLDDVQMYSRPLTTEQVDLLMNWPSLSLSHTPSLVARWQLNEPSPSYLDSARAPGVGQTTLTKALLESELGAGAGTNVFFRVYESPALGGFERCE